MAMTMAKFNFGSRGDDLRKPRAETTNGRLAKVIRLGFEFIELGVYYSVRTKMVRPSKASSRATPATRTRMKSGGTTTLSGKAGRVTAGMNMCGGRDRRGLTVPLPVPAGIGTTRGMRAVLWQSI